MGTDLALTASAFRMFQRPTLPNDHKVLVVGEAPGENEEREGVPFIGAAGDLLNDLLRLSGFQRRTIRRKGEPPLYESELSVTNVFSERPPGNDLKQWTANKTELKRAGYDVLGRLPQIERGRYLLPEHEWEVSRLHAEIRSVAPDLIIALGGKALWALTGDSRITMARGNFFTPRDITETASAYLTTQAIASFHPAMVLRQWDSRPVLWADLSKARRWLDGTLPPPLARTFYVDPSFEEIEHVYEMFAAVPKEVLGVDIETDPRQDQITSISYSTATVGICIPIFDKYALPEKAHYWKTAAEEAKAWEWIRRYAELPNPKVGQNFLYDHQYLLEPLDIRVRRMQDDTAILQHSMQPELPKALGFLASVYLNEPSWKFMRSSTKDDNKADE